MYLKVGKKKIDIVELNKFNEKFKSFKFYLEKIDYGIKIRKKYYNTYFFCQKVDICITDKNDTIIKLYEAKRSEKARFFFRARYIYYLPLDTVKHFKTGEKLNIKK